jgi:hypothetical protein
MWHPSYTTATIDLSSYSGEITICIAGAIAAACFHANIDDKSVTNYWVGGGNTNNFTCSINASKQLSLAIKTEDSSVKYPFGAWIMSGTIT